MKKILFTIFSFALLVISGCSSIVNGKTQHLNVEAFPFTAVISLTANGHLLAQQQGMLNYDLQRGNGFFSGANYDLEVSLNGYKTRFISLRSSLSGWYLGNIFFGAIPGALIIDPLTGGMWVISAEGGQDISSLHVQLLQDTPVSQMKLATKVQ